MAEKLTVEKPKAITGTGSNPESPRTAHDPSFDDDEHEQTTDSAATASAQPASTTNTASEEAPPPKPPRPMSAQAQAENTLIEAFPSTDPQVIKAVLVASHGQVEPAFNALLSMTDPNFSAEEPAPPQPPRPAQGQPRSQVERDEEYARQLAAHYQRSAGHEGYGSRPRGEPPLPGQRQQTGLKPNELYDDREHSFLDDDLPVFQESIKKTFNDTRTKFNKWISDVQKKFDGEDEEDDLYADRPGGPSQRQNFGPSQSEQMYGIRKSADQSRRSGDRHRSDYDADAGVISDDFTKLELRDEEAPPPKPNRPLANPDLFKPTPKAPQSGPVDEVDAVPNRQPSPGTGKTKKWQPLTSIAPNPESEDNDPFSLGDSDDEHEKEAKKQDIKAEDTERLKRSASVSENKEPQGTAKLEPAETTGSAGVKDQAAEEILKEAEKKP